MGIELPLNYLFGSPKLESKRMAMTHPVIRVHSRAFAVESDGRNRE
jgi:hypothetical protein